MGNRSQPAGPPARGGRAARATRGLRGARPRRRGARRATGFSATLGGIPLDLLLTAHVGTIPLEVREGREADLARVEYRLDAGAWQPLQQLGKVWRASVEALRLVRGSHTIEVRARTQKGAVEVDAGTFELRARRD